MALAYITQSTGAKARERKKIQKGGEKLSSDIWPDQISGLLEVTREAGPKSSEPKPIGFSVFHI